MVTENCLIQKSCRSYTQWTKLYLFPLFSCNNFYQKKLFMWYTKTRVYFNYCCSRLLITNQKFLILSFLKIFMTQHCNYFNSASWKVTHLQPYQPASWAHTCHRAVFIIFITIKKVSVCGYLQLSIDWSYIEIANYVLKNELLFSNFSQCSQFFFCI